MIVILENRVLVSVSSWVISIYIYIYIEMDVYLFILDW